MTPEFWQIIEESMNERGDRLLQAATLTDMLVATGVDSVLEFSRAFDAAMDHLYTWDLWGAVYLAMGGCSDDMFEYVRAWFVADGETSAMLTRSSPELIIRALVGDGVDLDERWAKFRLQDGEHILYAAGIAHERLTGEWLPPSPRSRASEPSGEPWEEDELPLRFPAIYAALPEDGRGSDDAESPRAPADLETAALLIQASSGVRAFGDGDHATAYELLEPLIDDPAAWAVLSGLGSEMRADAAYAVGIHRLLKGDVAGAAATLRLVVDDLPEHPHIRRALAQVELARGELDAAADLVDLSPRAIRSERALAAKIAYRRGQRDEALRRALAELEMPPAQDEHPWDVAGSFQQFAQILVDLEAVDGAETMALNCATLLQDAPGDLPLFGHLQIVLLGIDRLRGQLDDGLEAALELSKELETSDLAECLRERARINGALGHLEDATSEYRRAIDLFEAAGELWEAQRTRIEAGDS